MGTQGIYGSNGWDSYGKESCCFLRDVLKNTGLQGSTLSGHPMITGFDPFELPTRAYYRKCCTLDYVNTILLHVSLSVSADSLSISYQ